MDREWTSSLPFSSRLRDRVVAMILEGSLAEGDPLPTVPDVAAEYRVNPRAVLEAYQRLIDEQLVESRARGGMFVCPGARDLLLLEQDGKLEQERWEELRRRAREADHRRKAEELAEARQLQLTMIPAVPSVPGWEISASMDLAAEVGGDYYDFRVSSTGSLTVAFGDAVGHGVRAGIIVASTKALFATIGDDEPVSGALLRFDEALRSMKLPRAHMCLLLARFDGDSIEIANAGMPPPILRRSDGSASELDVLGPPLGVRHPGSRRSHTVELAEGELLVLSSDGVAEARRSLHEPIFGYDAILSVILQSATSSPTDLSGELRSAVAKHLQNAPPSDDMTVVAVMRRSLAASCDGGSEPSQPDRPISRPVELSSFGNAVAITGSRSSRPSQGAIGTQDGR